MVSAVAPSISRDVVIPSPLTAIPARTAPVPEMDSAGASFESPLRKDTAVSVFAVSRTIASAKRKVP